MHSRIATLLDGWKRHHVDVGNFVIAGSDLKSRKEVANAIIQNLICPTECGKCPHCQKWKRQIHPDVLILEKTGASIKIDQVRVLRTDIRMGPYSAPYRVVQVPESDTLTPEAASALLKSVEETPHHTLFIFLAESLEALPRTLVSRCQKILLPDSSFETIQDSTSLFPDLHNATLPERLHTLDKISESRDVLGELNQLIRALYVSLRSHHANAALPLKRALETERQIGFHVQAGLALTRLAMDWST